jgi:nitroreductase
MQQPIAELINARYSCRMYRDEPIAADVQRQLADFVAATAVGPFGSQARFAVVAASPDDRQALKKLGTYGFIKGATGFLVGAVPRGARDCEDYGFLLEQAVLRATDLGLGTCWLGGTFTKSRFAARLGGLEGGEIMPAVVALGYPGDDGAGRIREREAGSRRLPASSLFFQERMGEPLDLQATGDYASVLEGVRMAPSATNKQPWRIVRRGDDWHFYVQRNKGYGKGSALFTVLRLADLQRVDLGIAMCHFELAARELGPTGTWAVDEPDLGTLGRGVEYTATWKAARA